MSSHDSDNENAAGSADIEIDIDTLIVEVQNRPSIWDKAHKDHKDRIVRLNMWDEVCENVIDEWNKLSDKKKRQIGIQLQKKWRNLKDTFMKELAIQKRLGQTRHGGKKKRPYVHFEALSFLASNPTERVSAAVSTDDENTEQDTQKVFLSSDNRPRKKYLHYLEQPSDPLDSPPSKRGKLTFDEDISFTEMLIPMLRKLDDDQKHFAKVEILNVLNLAKRYTAPDNGTKFSSYTSYE